MRGRLGRRLVTAGLAGGLALTGALPNYLGRALADTVVDLVQFVDSTTWVPDAPGLSGVAYRASNNSLVVVDMQNHDFTGFDGTNLWEYDLDTGTVTHTGSILPDDTDDPTGATIKPGSPDTLFVSSDSTMSVYVIQPGSDGWFGTGDDVGLAEISVDGDVEDPAYHPGTGHLYVLEGAGLIADIDPGVDGIFGNMDDPAIGTFEIPQNLDDQPLEDVEGLAYDPASGNLIASARFGNIYEFTTAGIFVQEHDTSAVPAESLSGLTAQPAAGAYPVTYWIAERGSDSTSISDGGIYRVTFGPAPNVPAPPVLDPITTPQSASEGSLFTLDANATDPNIGALTYSATGLPSGASINSSSGLLSWTPGESQGGGAGFNVTLVVRDPGMLEDSQLVHIDVVETNSPPVIQFTPLADLGHAEGEAINIPMFGNDPDLPAHTKTWSATGLPPGLSINGSTGLIAGTISGGATAGSPYTVSVKLTDNGAGNLFDQESFQWTVQNTNLHPPVLANISNKTVFQGNQLAFNASATDADGDGLGFSLVSPPSGAAITAGGHFTWTPSQAPGTYNVTIKVSDDGSPVRSDSQVIVVTVRASDPGDINPFIDDDGTVFENAIEWLDSQGITQGCNPPLNDRFCPNDFVTRGQMAAFLVRALHYSDGGGINYFTDDNGHVFENAINRLRTAGVTMGCNPPANDRYCPNAFVTRGQMAAFLVRAFGYTAGGSVNYFTDDNGHVFESAINKLRTAGVTMGCNPPANDRYCPNDRVTRGQMAAFLKRALGG